MEELLRLKRRLLMVLRGLFFTFMPLLSPGDAHVLGVLSVVSGGPCTAAGILLLLGVLSVVAGVWELREAAAGGQKLFSKPKKRKKRKKRR